jgi:hypothetical protein
MAAHTQIPALVYARMTRTGLLGAQGSWACSENEWKHRQTPTAEVRKLLFVEKRKTAYRGMQGDPETGEVILWVTVGSGVS